jgi:hypothetical protein
LARLLDCPREEIPTLMAGLPGAQQPGVAYGPSRTTLSAATQ